MMSFSKIGVILMTLGMQVMGATIPKQEADGGLARRATSTAVADGQCTNGPSTRSCWNNGYSISTDFDNKHPTTGVTRTYNLEISNYTCSEVAEIVPSIGDGSSACKNMLLINGQYPGPVLRGNWGDDFVITVTNNMPDNGTSIHWHGIRQLNSCQYDGANGVTECPIPPGKSFTYKWKATQYGTTWYHSHHSAQYGDGVAGSIVIDGPATANYDEDLGPLPITDTYSQTAWALNSWNLHNFPGGTENLLINGTMMNADGKGRYNIVKVTKGKTYRLRLINMSVDSFVHFSLQGHKFQIITSDLVPVNPITVTSVLLAIGQRYDIVFTADQDGGNFWMHTDVATGCNSVTTWSSSTVVQGGILQYDNANTTLPAYSTSGVDVSGCVEQPNLKPFWSTTVPQADFESRLSGVNLTFDTTSLSEGLIQWHINDSAMDINWGKPTLQYIAEGNTSFPESYNIFNMDNSGQWYYWIIHNENSGAALAHPIHLHGHDFFVLGAGASSSWNGDVSGLTFNNPMRRDVAILYSGGYLILGFPADNPGAWLMHCHIAWHVTDGLSLQFLESPDKFAFDSSAINDNCAAWNSYYDGSPAYEKEEGDSGL